MSPNMITNVLRRSLLTRVAYNAGAEAVPRHPRYIKVPLYNIFITILTYEIS